MTRHGKGGDADPCKNDAFARSPRTRSRGGAQGLHQVRARGQQPLFQRGHFLGRTEDCDVPSELALKRRNFKAFDVDDAHLLAAAGGEPDRFHGRVAGPASRE